MSEVTIRPARPEDAEAVQKIMNDSKSLKWLGGFTMLPEIQGRIQKQEETGAPTLLVSEVDGVVSSECEITPKDHYMKMGLVSVVPDKRDLDPSESRENRIGLGSSMYALHACRAAVEGRLFLMDQIHWQNEVMRSYLESHQFDQQLRQWQRIRNFCSLDLLQYDLIERGIDHWLDYITEKEGEGFRFEFVHAPFYDEKLEKNLAKYKTLGFDVEEKVTENRQKVLDHFGGLR